MPRQTKDKRKTKAPREHLTWKVVDELTAWLEGDNFWQDGKIVWQNNGDIVSPTGKDLARAQRRLMMVTVDQKSAQRLNIDFNEWRAQRQRALSEAKFLSSCFEEDSASLVRKARQKNQDALKKTAELVCAEAVCLNNLPLAFSLELVKIGQEAEPHLLHLCQRDDTPSAVKGLLAMTLGNLRAAVPNKKLPESISEDEHLRRCYYWGMKFGVCREARVFVAILRERDGIDHAERFIRLFAKLDKLVLPPEITYKLLKDGMPTDELIRCVDYLVKIEAEAEILLRYRDELPPEWNRNERVPASQKLRDARLDIHETFKRLLFAALLHSHDSRCLVYISNIVISLFNMHRPTPKSMKLVAQWLNPATWDKELYVDYLKFMVDLLSKEWEDHKEYDKGKQRDDRTHAWLMNTYQHIGIDSAVALLKYTRDVNLVSKAHEKRLCAELLECPRQMLPILMRLVHDRLLRRYQAPNWLANLQLATTRKLSQNELVERLVATTAAGAVEQRHKYQDIFLKEISPVQVTQRTFDEAFEVLEELIRVVNLSKAEPFHIGYLAEDISGLQSSWPTNWKTYTQWMIGFISKEAPLAKDVEEFVNSLHVGVLIATKLCGDNLETFATIVQTLTKIKFRWAVSSACELGLKAIDKYPRAKQTLSSLLLTRHHAALEILMEIGRRVSPRNDLGVAIEEKLEEFAQCEVTAGWGPVIQLSQKSKPDIMRYVGACKMLKVDSRPPKSVLEILNSRAEMSAELASLEKLIQREDVDVAKRKNLQTRITNLRGYLKDEKLLRESARKLLHSKLNQLAAEMEYEALHQIIQEKYQERLGHLLGEKAKTIVIDDDWANAVRMWVTITNNRRTLKRMLQAIADKEDWIHEHPVNKAFLESAKQKDINTQVWLNENRRTYETEYLPGKQITLYLENNPLRCLQMGNYAGTCLGFADWGVNAYSTVPNAVELNKRVIYALNQNGDVIGRKLIAITREFELVGFHTYSWNATQVINHEVVKIFHQYCTELAKQLNIKMENYGIVDQLFCQQWYDDGKADWVTNKPIQ